MNQADLIHRVQVANRIPHEEVKTFKCRHCGSVLLSLKELRRHQREDCHAIQRDKDQANRCLRGEAE